MIHLILFIVLISAVVRIVSLPFRHRHCHRGFGYGYGYRRRHSGLFSILALVALERMFGRRW